MGLSGRDRVVIGAWQRLAFEVKGHTCHVNIGDMSTPKLTFSELEMDSRALGFQPRSVGGEVWVDNVRVTALENLSYAGSAIPAPSARSDGVITTLQVLGQLEHTRDDAARRPDATRDWRSFPTDARGTVVTGRVVDYHGPARWRISERRFRPSTQAWPRCTWPRSTILPFG